MSDLYPLFEGSFVVPGVAANSPYFQIKMREIGVMVRTQRFAIQSISIEFDDTTATEVALLRTATPGVPTAGMYRSYSSLPWVAYSSNALLVTAWDTVPTFDSGALAVDRQIRSFFSPGIAGTTVLWEWGADSPLIGGSGYIDSNTGVLSTEAAPTVVLWNVGSGVGGDIRVTISFNAP